jgi:ATP-dependent helicase HrpB
VGVSKTLLERHFKKQFQLNSELSYDETEKKYFKLEFQSLWDLPLEEGRRRNLSADEYETILPELCLHEWSFLLETNEALRHWFQRWEYCETKFKYIEKFWNEARKKQVFDLACMGEKSIQDLGKKDLVYFFVQFILNETLSFTMLERDLSNYHQQLPEFITAPTGSRFRVFYHLNQPPHIEVRLQELFGMVASPTVGSDAMPITIHLLGPNYRPVQVTSDLSSFWKNTYPEVRKEMRLRYPKHSWPEDPLTALPVAKGRSVKSR